MSVREPTAPRGATKAKAPVQPAAPVVPVETPAPVTPETPAAPASVELSSPTPVTVVAINDRVALVGAIAALGGIVLFSDMEPAALGPHAEALLPAFAWSDLRAELLRRFDLGELAVGDIPIELRITTPGDVLDAAESELLDSSRSALGDGAFAHVFSLEADRSGHRRHRLQMHLDRDGERHEPGSWLSVSYDEFKTLRALSVFAGNWEDGES